VAEELTASDIAHVKSQVRKSEEIVDELLKALYSLETACVKMYNLDDDDLSEERDVLRELKEPISRKVDEILWIQDGNERRLEELEEIQELREEAMTKIRQHEELEQELQKVQDLVDNGGENQD
jgi:ribosome-binding ATPase YchF (GTP1/OBG family)